MRWWDSDKNDFYISFCTLWRTESLRHSLKLVPPPFHKGGLVWEKLLDGFSTSLSAKISRVVEGADPYRLCHDTIPQPRRRLYLLKSCRAVPWCRRYKQHGFNKPAGASPRPTTWVYAKILDGFLYESLHRKRSPSLSQGRLGLCEDFRWIFYISVRKISTATGYAMTTIPQPRCTFHKRGFAC